MEPASLARPQKQGATGAPSDCSLSRIHRLDGGDLVIDADQIGTTPFRAATTGSSIRRGAEPIPAANSPEEMSARDIGVRRHHRGITELQGGHEGCVDQLRWNIDTVE